MLQEYIDMLTHEIKNYVKQEATHGLNREGEADLHLLFENRKHAMEFLREKGTPAPAAASRTGN